MKRMKFAYFIGLFSLAMCLKNGSGVNVVHAFNGTHEHNYKLESISVNPTIYKDGVGKFVCSECGFSKEDSIPKYELKIFASGERIKGIAKGSKRLYENTKNPAKKLPYVQEHKHSWKSEGTEKETCEFDSTELYRCECGWTRVTHEHSKTGHVYSAEKDVIKEPTCTEQGYTTHSCSKCGNTFVDSYKDALGHDYDVNGKCSRCGLFDIEKMEPGVYDVVNGEYKQVYSWNDMIAQKMFTVDKNGLLIQNDLNIVTESRKWDTVIGKRFLKIDDSVKKIDNSSLRYMQITGLYLPKSVSNYTTSYMMKYLKTMIVSSENKNYKVVNNALYSSDMKTLYFVPREITGSFQIDARTKVIAGDALALTSFSNVSIPEGVENICGGAFKWSYITSIHLPKTVKTMSANPFPCCSKLKSVTIDSANPYFTSFEGSIYSNDMKTLLVGATGRTDHYKMPNTVEILGSHCFDGATGLTIDNLSDNLKQVKTWAFYNTKFNNKECITPDTLEYIQDGGLGFRNVERFVMGKNIWYIGRCGIRTPKRYNVSPMNALKFNDTSKQWYLEFITGGNKSENAPIGKFSIKDKTEKELSDMYAEYEYYRWRTR